MDINNSRKVSGQGVKNPEILRLYLKRSQLVVHRVFHTLALNVCVKNLCVVRLCSEIDCYAYGNPLL